MLPLPIGEGDIQKMPFTPSKPSAQSVKGIFFIMIPLVLKNHICLVVESIINIWKPIG